MTRTLVALALLAGSAQADPLRLRGDALATTASPAGLLTLEASGSATSLLSAEAVVWMAGQQTPGQDTRGDVLVIALRARDRTGRARATLGRFVATVGALRPVHIDGASARLQLPRRFAVEAYGGIPVQPGLATSRMWDWLAAGRVSRTLGDWGSAGVAFLEQRDRGQIATEELGIDAGAAIGKRSDVAAKLAYDVANPGLAAVTFVASRRKKQTRVDVFATHREPSHLLPATSLFSVLGDVASQEAGVTLSWRAAPRLQVGGDVAARRAADELAPAIIARAKLDLDPRGASALGAELRRDGVGDDEWTGLRGTARMRLSERVSVATELELVIPDVDRGTGRVWPWGLAALSWERSSWRAALAIEASSTPSDARRLDALVQLGQSWGAR